MKLRKKFSTRYITKSPGSDGSKPRGTYEVAAYMYLRAKFLCIDLVVHNKTIIPLDLSKRTSFQDY